MRGHRALTYRDNLRRAQLRARLRVVTVVAVATVLTAAIGVLIAVLLS